MITRRLGAPLAALCLLFAPAAGAELSSYRIELLVFRHLDAAGEPERVERLPAHAGLPTLTDAVPPDGITLHGEMTPTLADAWRRLRLSATYRPVLYASWSQDNTQFQPPMRLHGEEVLHEELHYPGDWVVLDLAAGDPLAAYRLPFYRLDGHARLRRSRFLHVDLDLELRDLAPEQAVPGEPPAAAIAVLPARDEIGAGAALPAPIEGEDLLEPAIPAGPWRVDRLRQSRQVRVGELHYFDSPALGVLARVTAAEPPP